MCLAFPPTCQTLHLHVINITGVGHLLNVDAGPLLGASDSSDDALLNDVLQVRESSPNVPKIFKRVCSGTRIPVPEEIKLRFRKTENYPVIITDNRHLPVFNLICPLHIIDVHADLVVDVGRQVGAVGPVDVRKHNSGPEFLVVQETHGLVDQSLLISYRLQLVQVHTLERRKDVFDIFK